MKVGKAEQTWTGLFREGRYKALRAEGNPEFATILRVTKPPDLKIAARAG